NHVSFTLKELAGLCDGELRGDPAQKISGAASLSEAGPGEITFYAAPRSMWRCGKKELSGVFVPWVFFWPSPARREQLLRRPTLHVAAAENRGVGGFCSAGFF